MDTESLEHLSDEEVLALSLAKPDVFAELVRRYKAPFLRRVEYMLRSKEEAEDIVQEAFVRIYINAGRFKKVEGARFQSWAYRILINLTLTRAKKLNHERKMSMPELEPELIDILGGESDTDYEHHEIRDYVLSLLSKIPTKSATLLRRRFLEERTYGELAEAEAVSESVMRVRVHRALQELKKIQSL